ncbi:hypothetical protein OG436_16195 [Streptomyces caniferus]|uniref:Uncharacterized protein n=1 Tax=Streptomyces caniferus TaxID=285557 RepID=A0ABZ1VYY2_9ACTN|nr:hypothetical protein [Streptomyces caniferus]
MSESAPQAGPDAAPQDGPRGAPAQAPAPSSPARPARKPAARLIFDDPLNQQSSDDTDRGWGERADGRDSAADLARFLDEKPPHHL